MKLPLLSKEIAGLIVGAVLGAAPFLWVWFAYGRGAQGFDASEMWGMPAIVIAPLGGAVGAVIGMAVAGRK